MLSLDKLQMFKVAADKGSFSAAAKAMNKGVNTISAAIMVLEEQLGLQLFDRSGRRPVLTGDGQRLYSRAQVLFHEVQRIEHMAQDSIQEVESQVKIGVGELMHAGRIERAIEKVMPQYPDTRVLIIRDDPSRLLDELANRSIDIALMANFDNLDERFAFTGAGPQQLSLVCAPDYHLADMELVDAKALFKDRQIACSGMIHHPLLSRKLLFSPDVWETSSMDDMLRFVEQGFGWAIVASDLAQEKVQAGSVIQFNCTLLSAGLQIDTDLVSLANHPLGPVTELIKNSILSQN
ncbi:LysR family transcriptional regulator [Paraferrimonas sedimenticola]|uniref:LysR family transcriptional regulator n=1 Tax=Paraferrimonas sedimenticola TaxID=375674 RepID=A0AA37RVG9_9GAMM|nr:LysR family transcriptional regulator [Paraferrimonas sedimenticola]GLP96060.1 LysR family transcriptional regulator [Paraferrimonas sedimenticola]